MLLVEHDVDLVMSTCDRIVVIDFGARDRRGHARRGPCEPAVRDAYLGRRRRRGIGDHDGRRRRSRGADMSVTTTATPLIECRGLSAGYGKMAAIRDVDLHVEAGEVVALIGRNGAGKTTTLLGTVRSALADGGRGALDGRSHHRAIARSLQSRPRLSHRGALDDHGHDAADNLRLGGVASDDAVALFPELAHSSNEPPGSVGRRAADARRWPEPSVATLACCSPTSCRSASRRSS